MMRVPSTFIACLVALLLGTVLVSQSPGVADRDLGGLWKLVLWKGEARDGRRVTGELALLRGSWIDRANLVSVRSHSIYGIYDVDFTAFGFDCRPQRGTPLAGGRNVSPDSAEVVLNPQTDHGGVALVGRFSGDSIAGVWYERRSGGSSGRFVMRRE